MSFYKEKVTKNTTFGMTGPELIPGSGNEVPSARAARVPGRPVLNTNEDRVDMNDPALASLSPVCDSIYMQDGVLLYCDRVVPS